MALHEDDPEREGNLTDGEYEEAQRKRALEDGGDNNPNTCGCGVPPEVVAALAMEPGES